jgi:hypothetical protein
LLDLIIEGKGIFSAWTITRTEARLRIQDLPGFHAIGRGSAAAMYMMAYREVSSVLPLRLALYYAVEGKYFGEQAGGVGTKTDVLVLRWDKKPFKLTTKVIEGKLFKLCMQLEPRVVRKPHVDKLNSLSSPGFSTIPKLTIAKDGSEWVIGEVEPKPSASRKSKGQP